MRSCRADRLRWLALQRRDLADEGSIAAFRDVALGGRASGGDGEDVDGLNGHVLRRGRVRRCPRRRGPDEETQRQRHRRADRKAQRRGSKVRRGSSESSPRRASGAGVRGRLRDRSRRPGGSGTAFDIHKYRKIRDRLVADRLVAKGDFRVPEPVTTEQIFLVQTKTLLENLRQPARVARYLEAPEAGDAAGRGDRSQALGPLRLASGATILAARAGRNTASPSTSAADTTTPCPTPARDSASTPTCRSPFAALQKQGAIKTARVVDLDVHQGNGTAVCLKDDPTGVHVFDSPGRHLSDPQGERRSRRRAARRNRRRALSGNPSWCSAGPPGCREGPARFGPSSGGLRHVGERPAGRHEDDARWDRRAPMLTSSTSVSADRSPSSCFSAGLQRRHWQVQHASIRRTLEKYGIAKPTEKARLGVR